MKNSLAKVWLFLLLFSFISCNEQGAEESSSDDDSSPGVTTPTPNPSPTPPKDETPPKITYRHDPQREAVLEEIENLNFILNDMVEGNIKKEVKDFFSVFDDDDDENDESINDDEDDESPEISELNELFIHFLSNEEEVPADDGYQHFKYTPAGNICSDILAENNPAVCEEAIKKLDFILTIQDESNSSLTVNYNGFPLMTFDFTEEGRNYEVNIAAIGYMLGDINNLNASLSPEDYDLNPPILQGGISLSRSQEGGEIFYQLDISDDIYISTHVENGMYDFSFFENTQEILTLALNKNESKLGIVINTGLIYLNEIKDFDGIKNNFSTYLNDLSGEIIIDNKNSVVVFKNFFSSSIYNAFNNITDSIVSFSPLTVV